MKNDEPRKLSDIRINRPKELAQRLGVPLPVLKKLASGMDLRYRSWTSEKNGKSRTFYQAEHDLEAVHQALNTEIFDRFDFPQEFQGAIKGRSLRTNALIHAGKKNIARFDIKKFFPSVSSGRVYATFVRLGCQPNVARLITRLITAEGRLPQGFKTSPKVAALVLLPVNERIKGLTRPLGVSPSFWVDDLSLSGAYPLRTLKPSVRKIFRQSGFTVHKDEDSPTYNHERQVVTGVVVNTKPSIKKETRSEVEKIVFLAEKNGLRWYKRRHAPALGLMKIAQRVNGRIANMMAIDRDKYEPLQRRWYAVLEHAGVREKQPDTTQHHHSNTRC